MPTELIALFLFCMVHAVRAVPRQVWAAVKLLENMGQHKTARRLKYGHLAWEIQNSTKTDRNMFFASRNLLQLEAQLDAADTSACKAAPGQQGRCYQHTAHEMHFLLMAVAQAAGSTATA